MFDIFNQAVTAVREATVQSRGVATAAIQEAAPSDSAQRCSTAMSRPPAQGQRKNFCRDFMNTGKCNKGDATGFGRCQFLHLAPGELSKPAAKGLETRSCFDFINKGRCQFGDDCRFRHPKPGDPAAAKTGKRQRSEFESARAWAASQAEKEARRKNNGGGQGGTSQAAHVIEGKSSRPTVTLPACIAKVLPVAGPQPLPKSADPPPQTAASDAAAEKMAEEEEGHLKPSSGGGLLGLGDYDSSSGDEQT